MPKYLKILIVEDNPDDAELLVRELKRAKFDFESERVDTEYDYLAKLKSDVDVILSDFEMPHFSGLRALELLKKQPALHIPFIIVSGTIGEEMAVTAMRLGATDYLLKDRTARLGPAVTRALQEVEQDRERKRLEAQFIEAQKMEVVGQLAGGVAHDFNNVLGVIMGYSDLLADDLGPDSPVHGYIEEIRHATKRAAGLTQQLLIFSRKQTVEAVALDPNDVVAGMEKMLKRLIDENIEMDLIYGKAIGHIKADSGYVWQVLMNMVVNARDAMPEGGRLTIETSAVILDQAFVETRPGTSPGNYALISVTDTGVGMTEEIKSRIFEAFFTTKPVGKGTGLGLATCQTIVRQSGGLIEVTSEPGKGTTFRIYFPRMEGEGSPDRVTRIETGALAQGSETLLVVEDDRALRHLAQGVLRNAGYDVLTAPNGQDALRVAQEHRGPPIALVITDVVMPRMGGKVMAEWLKSTYPDMKILFTSGYTEESIAHLGREGEAVEFLSKPYTTASLTRKVRAVLDR